LLVILGRFWCPEEDLKRRFLLLLCRGLASE
jgi:hypothetical protein